MQFKEEKYRVRYEQLHKDRIRNKGLGYGLEALGGTVHCKLNIYQRVAQISNGTLLGKGQLLYWDGEMTIIVWSIFLIQSAQMLPQLENCAHLQAKHFEKDMDQLEKPSSLLWIEKILVINCRKIHVRH